MTPDGGTGFGWYVTGFGTLDQIDLQDVAFVTATTKKGAQTNST
jgi:hypothetical protein